MAVRLNDAQRQAVESDEPILCCACPGSGKTRVLIAKVRHILETHPDPRIIMTTFSRDAADEMLERIRDEKGLARDQIDRLTIGTFHSLARRQLMDAGRMGRILSEIECRHLIARAIRDVGSDISIEDAEAAIARCKADRVFARHMPSLGKLTETYKIHQESAGGQDFTDLLLEANNLMVKGALAPLPATHILADEFQDIDQLQFDWLLHHLKQGPSVCAVGDDDQSIYAFRRSLGYRGMMEFAAVTGATIVTLDTNYRSTAGIVEAASKLIAYNSDRVQKTIKAARGPGPQPAVVRLCPDDDQAMHIVHRLDEICAGNDTPKPLPGRDAYRFGVRKGQAAVLARTNASLHRIESIFRNEGVPYLRAGRSFWDARVLQVYVAMLEALVKHDGMGLEIGLRWAKADDDRIRLLVEDAEGSLWNYLEPGRVQAPRASDMPAAESMLRLGRGWQAKLAGAGPERAALGPIYGVAAWMSMVLTNTYPVVGAELDADADDAHSAAVRELPPEKRRELDRLAAARDALADASGSLATRLKRLRQADDMSIPRVVLTTFHASKGLEWDHVFLVDVHTGAVPKFSLAAGEDELAEERRVFYVAMTRARDSLTILARSDKAVSEFLVDAELVARRKPLHEEESVK